MNIGNNSAAQIKAIVERIERLEEEKKSIAEDVKDVYAEAKSNGFDVKALREIIRLRKQDADKRAEHEAIVETYMNALNMLEGTVFEDAARANAARANAATQGRAQ